MKKEENKTFIDTITFKKPLKLEYEMIYDMFESKHESECCERHELDFDDVSGQIDTAKLVIDKVDKIDIYGEDGMGITLFLYDGDKRSGIFIPGRGSNNGYYSDDLTLIVDHPDGYTKEYDITEYQDIS